MNSLISDKNISVRSTIEQMKANIKNTKHLSKCLVDAQVQRTHFDANNKDDLSTFAKFLKTGKWDKKFYVEWPAVSVVSTIEKKIIQKVLETYETT